MKSKPHDFSFSGIKTAMLYHLRRHPELQPEIDVRQQALARGERTADALRQLSSRATLDLVASFQRAVVDDLTTRTLAAAELHSGRTILVYGGVAANRDLRTTLESEPRRHAIDAYSPSRALSTDNAAMIAAAAHPRYLNADFADATLNAEPNLALA